MAALLSIKPIYASAIWHRTKRYEYRRRVFDTLAHTDAYVYTTAPISMVTGRFSVEDVIVGSPLDVWEVTSSHAGIDRENYLSYFEGRSVAFAIAIDHPEQFAIPVNLKDVCGLIHPPQSYALFDDVVLSHVATQ